VTTLRVAFKSLAVSITLIVCLLLLAFFAYTFKPELIKVHENIEATYHGVSHIDAEVFSKLEPEKIVVFDVRELIEYDVSHLQGAIQLDPEISDLEFETTHGHLIEGKTVIFYCSVGKRSSSLASQLQNAIFTSGASNAFNLIGGIFQWHNESRHMVRGQARETTKIHPYNKYWARYISHKGSISYTPEEDPE